MYTKSLDVHKTTLHLDQKELFTSNILSAPVSALNGTELLPCKTLLASETVFKGTLT